MKCSRFSFLVAFGACQGTPSGGNAAPQIESNPRIIEVRDGGTTIATVEPRLPCRATIDGVEMQVGTAPLVTQIGTVRWSGNVASNGTMFSRDGEKVARMYSAVAADDLALIDPQGIAIVRISRSHDTPSAFIVADRTGELLRTVVVKSPGHLEVLGEKSDKPVLVSGTDDQILAAILTTTETSPELRGLAACHRLFPIEKVQ